MPACKWDWPNPYTSREPTPYLSATTIFVVSFSSLAEDGFHKPEWGQIRGDETVPGWKDQFSNTLLRLLITNICRPTM